MCCQSHEDSLDSWLLPFMHLYTARAAREFSSLGLHPGQIPVIFMINRHEGITLRELADRLHIKPPTVTVTVQKLSKQGILEKQDDEKDQRIYHLFLTAKGRDLLSEAEKMKKEINALALQGLGEKEIGIFYHCLETMKNNLLKVEEGEDPFSTCP